MNGFTRAEQLALGDRVGPVGRFRLGDMLEDSRFCEGDRSRALARFAGYRDITGRYRLVEGDAASRDVGSEGGAESIGEIGYREGEESERNVPVEEPVGWDEGGQLVILCLYTQAACHTPSSEARLKVESVPLWCALWYAAPISRGQSLVGHDEA